MSHLTGSSPDTTPDAAPNRHKDDICLNVRYASSPGSAERRNGVEVGLCSCGDRPAVLVRDAKLGAASPVLRCTVPSWISFTAALKTMMLGYYRGPVEVVPHTGDTLQFRHSDAAGAGLVFDRQEWAAFLGDRGSGVHGGQFDPDALARDCAGPCRPA
jgi:hypothetical protein